MASKYIRVLRTDWKRVKQMLREWDGGTSKGQQKATGPIEDVDKRLWLTARNDFASEAPAYGVAKVTDGDVDDRGHPFLKITQPTADSTTGCVLIRHRPIAPGKFGQVTYEPFWGLYASGTPVYDQEWGSEANTWNLKSGATGFKVLRSLRTTPNRVLVKRVEAAGTPVNVIKFALTQALSTSDATATASLSFVVTGTGPGGGFSVTNLETGTPGAYVFSGATGNTGYAIQRTSNSDWEILQLQCG